MKKISKMNKSSDSQLFAISCWGMLSIGMTFSSLGPLLAPISDTFHFKLGQLALPVVSHSLGFLTANILMALVWRIQRARFLFTLSGLLTFLMLISISLFSTARLLFTFLFFLGVAQGTMHTGLDSFFSEISGEKRVRYLNWLHIFIGLGAVLGPLSVGILLSYSEKWRLVYLIMAMVSLPLPLLFFRGTLYQSIIYSGKPQTPASTYLVRPITSPFFWLAMIGIFSYVGLELSFASWTPIFLIKTKNISYALASYSISIFWLTLVIGRFLFGRFFHKTNLSFFLGAGALVAALFTAFTFSTDYPVFIGLFIALSGLSLSWFYPSILALGANTFPRQVGVITGSLAASGTVGSIVFPWIIGPVSETLGLPKGVFLIPLLCLGLTGIFFYYTHLFRKL